MSGFEVLRSWVGRSAVLPPITDRIVLTPAAELAAVEPPDAIDADPEPISAFLCMIDYDGETRLITCRRYEGIGEHRYVGAICHAAKGYRQFRCDRIEGVFDAQTGEQLGDGQYFDRFSLDSYRERPPTWGLTPGRKMRLVAGLNALAFMARCDGHWHSLEGEVIERFIVSLWLRQEWPGDPDVAEILQHTERLAPDADVFFKALKLYAESDGLSTLLRRSMAELIAADGRICPAEMDWATEVETFFRDYSDARYRELFGESCSE